MAQTSQATAVQILNHGFRLLALKLLNMTEDEFLVLTLFDGWFDPNAKGKRGLKQQFYKGAEKKKALAVLARLLRNPPLHPILSSRLADHFDPDQTGRTLKFGYRQAGSPENIKSVLSKNDLIAFHVFNYIQHNGGVTKRGIVTKALEHAEAHFEMDFETIRDVWEHHQLRKTIKKLAAPLLR